MDQRKQEMILVKSFETDTIVDANGEIRLSQVPYSPGTEVQVSISPKRQSAAEFLSAWQQVCDTQRNMPHLQQITDAEIQHEIDDYRTGR